MVHNELLPKQRQLIRNLFTWCTKSTMQLNSYIIADHVGNVHTIRGDGNYGKLNGLPRIKYVIRNERMTTYLGLTYDGDIYNIPHGESYENFAHWKGKAKELYVAHNTFYVFLENKDVYIFNVDKMNLGVLICSHAEHVNVLTGTKMDMLDNWKVTYVGIFAILSNGDSLIIHGTEAHKSSIKFNVDNIRFVRPNAVVMKNSDMFFYENMKISKCDYQTILADSVVDLITQYQTSGMIHVYLHEDGTLSQPHHNEKVENRFLRMLNIKQFVLMDIEYSELSVHFIDDVGDLYKLSRDFCVSDVPLPFSLIYSRRFKNTKSAH